MERETWFYGCTSYILPGLGQILSGKIMRGIFLLTASLTSFILFFYFILTPQFLGVVPAVICATLLCLLSIIAALDAKRQACLKLIKTGEFPVERGKDRWWVIFISIFLGSISTGFGYLYLKKWFCFTMWLVLLILIVLFKMISFNPLLPEVLKSVLAICVLSHVFILIKRRYGYGTNINLKGLAIFVTVAIFYAIPMPFTLSRPTKNSVSMEPTLMHNEYIIVNKQAFLQNKPKQGDIVILETGKIPKYMEYKRLSNQKLFRILCKRVVATEGDMITIIGFHVYVNGKSANYGFPPETIDETKLNSSTKTFVIPKGQYFVLGDNFYKSLDSRYWGTVPKEAIKGKVIKVVWPFDKARILK